MSTLEQIRDLSIENVEPEHFIELGSEVVQALRDILGDDAVREIVIIEIVHAFKDIIIEYIDRRYQSSPER